MEIRKKLGMIEENKVKKQGLYKVADTMIVQFLFSGVLFPRRIWPWCRKKTW